MATRRSVSGQAPKQAPAKRKSPSARRTRTRARRASYGGHAVRRTPPTLDLMAPSVPLLQMTAPINPGHSGLLKMLFHREDRRLRGVHVTGTGATELIHFGQAVLGLRGRLDDFLTTACNYPPLAECYKVPRWMRTTTSRVKRARRCRRMR